MIRNDISRRRAERTRTNQTEITFTRLNIARQDNVELVFDRQHLPLVQKPNEMVADIPERLYRSHEHVLRQILQRTGQEFDKRTPETKQFVAVQPITIANVM